MLQLYFDALFAENVIGMLASINAMCDADKLRVYLACGAGGPFQYGFGAEVGRG